MHGGQHAEIDCMVGNRLKIQWIGQGHIKTGRMLNGLTFGIAIRIIGRIAIAENIAVERQQGMQMRFTKQNLSIFRFFSPLRGSKRQKKCGKNRRNKPVFHFIPPVDASLMLFLPSKS